MATSVRARSPKTRSSKFAMPWVWDTPRERRNMSTEQDSAVTEQTAPLAVVRGEAVLQMPQDLYIPPEALEVFLDQFSGPLDLLLYLIRKQNLDILDIPIADVTRQYMQYIEVMADLQLELAGEYLLMAA